MGRGKMKKEKLLSSLKKVDALVERLEKVLLENLSDISGRPPAPSEYINRRMMPGRLLWSMAFPLVVLFYAGVTSGQQSVIDVHVCPQHDAAPVNAFNSSLTANGAFSLKTIFEGPTFIVTIPPGSYDFSQARVELKLTAYYADRGLRSIVDYANFQSLHQQLLTTPHTSGLAYPDVSFNNEYLLSSVIKEMVIPDGFRTIDILYAVRRNNTHVLYLAPTDFFVHQGFSGLKTVGRFLVDAFSVEPIFSDDPNFIVKPNPLTEKIRPKVEKLL